MFVVDTSVVVKWVIPEDEAHADGGMEAALSLLEGGMVAPDCLVAEFANALFKKVRRGEMTVTQATEATAILPEIVGLVPSVPLVPAALRLAFTLPHPVHDCLFLAAAQVLDLTLVTADAKFVNACMASGQALPIELLR